MPFDIFTTNAIRDELASEVVGGRVDKIIQPSELSVALRIWSPTWSGSILLSADPRQPRVYATQTKLSKGLETPPPFLMLLRKYCTAARIESVEVVRLDRILMLVLNGREHGQVYLRAEIMGNRSNVILTSDENVILGALKSVGPKQSRTRRIGAHLPYLPPAPQQRNPAFGEGRKIDPASEGGENGIRAALGQAPPSMSAVDALVGLIEGCSPPVARDIVALSGLDAARPVAEQAAALAAATERMYRRIDVHDWQPIVVIRDGVAVDYKAYNEPPTPGAEPAASMSSAVESVSTGMESTDPLLAARRSVRSAVSSRGSEIRARLASLEKGMLGSKDADSLIEQGNLVLGFQYQIGSDDDVLEVPETNVRIPLDPQLSPVENAERHFKRGRKAREAGKRLPALIERAQGDARFVEDLDTYIDLAETPTELNRVAAELDERFGNKSARLKPKRPQGAGRILTVDLAGEIRILIGRSALQNEEVTFKMAGRGDLWLHVRGAPGAHVVVKGAQFEALEHDEPTALEAARTAAALAAYYSKSRSEPAADVIVTRVRDVHRLPGGAPGQVTVRNERTIRVAPQSPDAVQQTE